MKITLTNIDNNYDGANIMIKQIISEVLEELKEPATEIKLEEMSVVYSIKPEGQEDYHIVSVEHDGLEEMLEVDYNLKAGVKEDNTKLSLFTDTDRQLISDNLHKVFETVEPVIPDELLTFKDQRIVGDLVVRNFNHEDGRTVTRVFQMDSSEEHRLIQEFSFGDDTDNKGDDE